MSCIPTTSTTGTAVRLRRRWWRGSSRSAGSAPFIAAVYEPNSPSIRLLQSLGFRLNPGVPTDQDTAGKGFPLLMFRLDSPQD